MLVILKAESGTHYRNKVNGVCSVWVNTFAPDNWELVEGELPPIDDTDEDATESDYITALQDLGVEVDA